MILKRIRKFTNRILHDKKEEFPLDAELKSKIELHNYLLDNVILLEKQIVPAKLKYYWENKKMFFLRLFLKFVLVVAVIAGILGGIWTLGYRLHPAEPVIEMHPITLYVPENADTAYIRSCSNNPDITFITIYPLDRSKDWDKFKVAIHNIESVGTDSASYRARRWETNSKGEKVLSQFWGRYQLGTQARKSVGIGNVSWEEFANNPEMQEGAFKSWIRILYKDMRPYIAKYDGEYMAGMQVTTSGILAMTHNVGASETIKFLESKGRYIPTDGNVPATVFLSIGGYDLTSILN